MDDEPPTDDRTPTRIEWRFDDADGQVFRRFSRKPAVEAWLIGRERPERPEHQDRISGGYILDGGALRPAKYYVWALSFKTPVDPVVPEMIRELDARFDWDLFNALLLLADPIEPQPARLPDEEISRIADALLARLNEAETVPETP